jgi:biotin--protein ligase
VDSDGQHTEVTISGLTDTGYLKGVDDSGQTVELHPDGNSFDFLKGLIAKKMAAPSQ